MELFKIIGSSSLLLTPPFRELEMNEGLGSQEDRRRWESMAYLKSTCATRNSLFTMWWKPYNQITE